MPQFLLYNFIYLFKRMKKSILALASLAFLGVQAQQVDYNPWSVDVNGGVNKATTPFTAGYGTRVGMPSPIPRQSL